jgi:hypothetical protein
MSLLSYPGSNIIFQEDFINSATLNNNKGTVVGYPTINNKLEFTAATGQGIKYNNTYIGNNNTTFSMRIKFKPPSASAFYLVNRYDGTTLIFHCFLGINGIFYVYAGSTSNAVYTSGYNCHDNVIHDIMVVYNGALSTNLTKLQIYECNSGSPVLISNASIGTIPTKLLSNNIPMCLGARADNVYAIYSEAAIYKLQFWDKAVSLSEMQDIIENDIIQEISPKKALINYPMRSWYYKNTGTQLLVDGDMELAGRANWADLRCSLAKVGNPYSGTQCLEITATAGTPAASQNILVVGYRYRVTGKCKSDGTAIPAVDDYVNYYWFGTTSTNWQDINLEFVAANTNFAIGSYGGSAGQKSYFDDMRLELMTAVTDNKGTLGGIGTLGSNGSVTAHIPEFIKPHGINCVTNYNKIAGNIALDTKTFTLAFTINTSNLTAASHMLFFLGNYNTNGFMLNAFGSILIFYWNSASGIGSAADFFTKETVSCIISSDNGLITIYRNGKYNTAVNATAKPNLNGQYNYSVSADGAYLGKIYNAMWYDFAFNASQARVWHNKMMSEINI